MTLPRADRLKEPPVVGRYYLVPAILWSFHATNEPRDPAALIKYLAEAPGAKWWPVWGRKHSDVEHFNFPSQHYHIDPRFMTEKHWRDFRYTWLQSQIGYVQAKPLNHDGLPDGPQRPTLRRMRCSRSHSQWEHPDKAPVIGLNKQFDGQTCRRGKRGLICPHRQFPLGSVEPRDGIITCPLHGLRIEASTGRCVGPAPVPNDGDFAGAPSA